VSGEQHPGDAAGDGQQTTARTGPVPFDTTVAHIARVYDYWLGGKDNFAAERGIRQFLDIGTGIRTADNTHEVAQAAAPESRIVYVDNDHCKPGCAHGCSDSLQRWRAASGYLEET
jgi:S-adenosyl methyltransferase